MSNYGIKVIGNGQFKGRVEVEELVGGDFHEIIQTRVKWCGKIGQSVGTTRNHDTGFLVHYRGFVKIKNKNMKRIIRGSSFVLEPPREGSYIPDWELRVFVSGKNFHLIDNNRVIILEKNGEITIQIDAIYKGKYWANLGSDLARFDRQGLNEYYDSITLTSDAVSDESLFKITY